MNDESSLKDPILPLGRPIIGSAGETGNWRSKKPALNEEKCIKCYQCWISCPEGTVRVDGKDQYPYIDYIYCKGCGICVHVCPKDALSMEPE